MSHTAAPGPERHRNALARARQQDRRALKALKRRTQEAALEVRESPRVDNSGATDGGVLYYWPGFPPGREVRP